MRLWCTLVAEPFHFLPFVDGEGGVEHGQPILCHLLPEGSWSLLITFDHESTTLEQESDHSDHFPFQHSENPRTGNSIT